ncbi:unnamed protein product [Parnassius apollo]|uniref:(apollo) hypothetical protein n=1 Tax=Parnassius apollo TaxID=110799 RepID=A0A8S3XI10_PARAO|nr:unnamed protein product [Parnassius apollo]
MERTPKAWLGLSLAGHRDRSKMVVFVYGMHPTGAAAKATPAVKVGDEILEVNGIVLHGRCHLNASAIIKGLVGPVFKIILLRRKSALVDVAVKPLLPTQFPVALKEDSEDRFAGYKGARDITIKKGPAGLGIMIIDGRHQEAGRGIFVSDLQEGSAAEQAGMQVGDMILAVNLRSSSPVQKYGVPKSRSGQKGTGSVSQEYSPSSRSQKKNTQQAHRTLEDFSFGTQSLAKSSRNSPSQIYGTPANSLTTHYSAPREEARKTGAYYGESGVLSTTYNRPNGRSTSQEYGVPETGAALKSSTLASSYPSARTPSRKHGAPSSRTAMPSPQYGASSNLDGYSDQSYESYARNSLELLNQDNNRQNIQPFTSTHRSLVEVKCLSESAFHEQGIEQTITAGQSTTRTPL